MSLIDQINREKIIHQLGLDRQVRTMDVVLPALGIFSAGLLVGLGVGLMVAPKSGRELRHDISTNIHDISERSQHYIHDATERARGRISQFRGENQEEAIAAVAAEEPNPYNA
jgi:gas vesicle protein